MLSILKSTEQVWKSLDSGKWVLNTVLTKPKEVWKSFQERMYLFWKSVKSLEKLNKV